MNNACAWHRRGWRTYLRLRAEQQRFLLQQPVTDTLHHPHRCKRQDVATHFGKNTLLEDPSRDLDHFHHRDDWDHLDQNNKNLQMDLR